MDNRGFTLIELLVTLAIISIAMISSILIINNTFGMTDEKSYEIMKKSIITQANQYILECDNEVINCNGDYIWVDNIDYLSTSFPFSIMKKYSYFSENNFVNPITKEDISNCLIINVSKDKYSTLNIELDDSKCMK